MKRMKNIKNEEAVSPVIGVILMVVITVIIAAVLAVFAFGVGAPTKSPTASVKITSINASGDTVTVQHFGGDTIRIKDTKITVETLNSDGAMLDTMVFDMLPAATGIFAAGDTLSITTSTTEVLALNGGTAFNSTTDYTPTGDIDFATAGTDSVRVTVIDTPSGGVLSKPAAKVT